MDTLTQGLLGAVAVQCGLRQKIGRGATGAAFLAAVLPDADIFFPRLAEWIGLGRPFDTFRYHRGATHALVAIPFLALLTAGAWQAWRSWRRRRGGLSPDPFPIRFGWRYACCFVSVATHGLLDACTSYGTQLFWPFSSSRIAWDCVPIVDLLYTPLLLLTLLGCFLVRRIRREHPLRAAKASLAIGIAGMILSTAYLAAGRVGHDIARSRSLAALGERQIVSAEAYPMAGSIFLWRVVLQTPEEWFVLRVRLPGDAPTPNSRRNISRAVKRFPESPFVQQARKTEAYAVFEWFARGQLRTAETRRGNDVLVDFHDMRYGRYAADRNGLWFLRFRFPADDCRSAEPAGVVLLYSSAGRWNMISRLWRELWNP